MRKHVLLASLITLLVGLGTASADVHVNGYNRRNGTYVRPHFRSNADGNFWNNWSTFPNVNPYTGVIGSKFSPRFVPVHVRSVVPGASRAWAESTRTWRTPADSVAAAQEEATEDGVKDAPVKAVRFEDIDFECKPPTKPLAPRATVQLMTDEERAECRFKVAARLYDEVSAQTAIDWCEEIIVKYPQTGAAQKAKEYVSSLNGR